MTYFLQYNLYYYIGDKMKKTLIILLIITILFINIKEPQGKTEELKGIFISYIELNKYLAEKDEQSSKKEILKMIQNIKKMNLNTIVLQVRSQQDAIYKSKIFPFSFYINKDEILDYDILEYFIEESHKKNIKLYVWVNPYRVRTNEDISTISNKNPVYKYINTDTLYINNGIYLNPSKEETNKLIIEGVKELLEYKIDGLLFDDYFYPDNNIDINDYNEYILNNPYIDKTTYNLQTVNILIKKVHEECKNKNIPFGISPDGNIENNYNKNYADVRSWLSSNEYIDFIIPQIYYGFYNSTKSYINTVKEWESLIKNNNIKFYIALAFYKVGREDNYAKEGKDEWIYNDNIIMKEIIISRNIKKYNGFVLFRYDNLFDYNTYTNNSIKEIENLKKIIN